MLTLQHWADSWCVLWCRYDPKALWPGMSQLLKASQGPSLTSLHLGSHLSPLQFLQESSPIPLSLFPKSSAAVHWRPIHRWPGIFPSNWGKGFSMCQARGPGANAAVPASSYKPVCESTEPQSPPPPPRPPTAGVREWARASCPSTQPHLSLPHPPMICARICACF